MADEPQLSEGATGEWVEYLQQWLNSLGFYCGAVDGEYGPVTQEAVAGAQERFGLGDGGVVGEETWHLVNMARTGDEARAEVVWGDYKDEAVDVPEIGSGDADAQEEVHA
jgi:peptidoglycan hydrolase-like protein with peptidoglycan-binding domain